MAHKQISKASNGGLDLVNTTTNFAHPSTATEALRRENPIPEDLWHDDLIDYLKLHVPQLREFRGTVMIADNPKYTPMVYNPTSHILTIDTDFAKLLYDVSELGNHSKGLEAIFAHELAHEKLVGSTPDTILGVCLSEEAAAELSAIAEGGLEVFIDSVAISAIGYARKQFRVSDGIQDRKVGMVEILNELSTEAAELIIVKVAFLDHYSVSKWHDDKFMEAVSVFYPPAKEVANRIPTDYDLLTKLIMQRVDEITGALKRAENLQADHTYYSGYEQSLLQNSIT